MRSGDRLRDVAAVQSIPEAYGVDLLDRYADLARPHLELRVVDDRERLVEKSHAVEHPAPDEERGQMGPMLGLEILADVHGTNGPFVHGLDKSGDDADLRI